ncbi:MAG: hypothetical protein K0Q77_1793 [Anaerosporomusa subterranea]|nr:hypothetical protein [Anaerosporomusa subterranea]
MLKWLVAFGLLLVFVYFIYQLNIYIQFRYQRRDNNDNVFIRVYAWRGILSYVIKVPVVQVDWQDEMLWFESEMKETKGGNKRINTVFERHLIKKVVDFIFYHPRRFRRLIEKFRTKLLQTKLIVRELHNKVRFDRFHCQVRFGLEDAAATGMLAGAFWMLKGLVSNTLRNQMTSGVCPVFTMTPVFGKDILVIDLECILRIRLGNIIKALYKADKQGGNNRG